MKMSVLLPIRSKKPSALQRASNCSSNSIFLVCCASIDDVLFSLCLFKSEIKEIKWETFLSLVTTSKGSYQRIVSNVHKAHFYLTYNIFFGQAKFGLIYNQLYRIFFLILFTWMLQAPSRNRLFIYINWEKKQVSKAFQLHVTHVHDTHFCFVIPFVTRNYKTKIVYSDFFKQNLTFLHLFL